MTVGQKAVVWFVAAVTCLLVGLAISAPPSGEQSDGWNMVAALVWIGTLPCTLMGVFYLIRAATRPD